MHDNASLLCAVLTQSCVPGHRLRMRSAPTSKSPTVRIVWSLMLSVASVASVCHRACGHLVSALRADNKVCFRPDFTPEEEEEVRRENQWAFE